jgi:glycosyltransferase involved in cell wall biosynthesis
MPHVDLNASHGLLSQIRTAGRLLYSSEAKKRLGVLLDEQQVDLAHLHNIHHQLSPSILDALKARKVPVVMTLHDYKMTCASYSLLADGLLCDACSGGKYLNILRKQCVKGSTAKSGLAMLEMFLHHRLMDIYDKVDVFIAPSAFLKEKLHAMGFRKKIVHLANFIDKSRFEGIHALAVTRDKSLTFFGRLSHEKGVKTLLRAWQKISDPGYTLKVIGDGPLRAELQQLVQDENIPSVVFKGFMSGDALFTQIAASDAVIVPSEWYENNPMSIIEAFALGKPVIGARIGGIPELVRDGETGFLFEAGNSSDLAAQITRCITEPEAAVRMGAQARARVSTELSPERHYERLVEIYQEAMGNRS